MRARDIHDFDCNCMACSNKPLNDFIQAIGSNDFSKLSGETEDRQLALITTEELEEQSNEPPYDSSLAYNQKGWPGDP